ncbi:hypothetical protein GobsT_27590 [Gemmata obscuriglobus]|nr:hypothetical protein GobsT_27590 [Gemmata obscuriglobus]VTS05508.1 unnamed protein product [Gemmata obscuriglobus UQM 2246]
MRRALSVLVVAVLLAPLGCSNRTEPSGPLETDYEHYEQTPEGKPICPKCGRSDQVRAYLYGLTRGERPEGTVGGGCVVTALSPAFRCGHCEARFGVTPMSRRDCVSTERE